MASGTIFVADGANGAEPRRLMFQRPIFECIIAGVKASFPIAAKECLIRCMRDWDEYCMEYIDLGEIDQECFKIFVAASKEGLQRVKEFGQDVIDRTVDDEFVRYLCRDWEALIKMLDDDERNN